MGYRIRSISGSENGRFESEVFNACAEAINEIQILIHRLIGCVSAMRYLAAAERAASVSKIK